MGNYSREVTTMDRYSQNTEIAKQFYGALTSQDWSALRALVTDNAVWTLPGENKISGAAIGGDALVARAKAIVSYGLKIELKYILLSRDNFALALHNTARRGDVILDEQLSTVCRLKEGKIYDIETYLSDVVGMNRFFER
jgi:ketosteroid isomerase-like protein